MKNFKILLMLILIWTTLDTVGQITIGGQVQQSTLSQPSPYNAHWESRHIQIVYTAAEINTAGGLPGNISALAWDISSLSTITLANYEVKMALTTATDASTHNSAALTTVKNAFDFITPSAIGWKTITFDTPFNWDGVQNILVDICWGVNSDYDYQGQVWLYNIVAYQLRYINNSSANQCSATTDYLETGKPRVQFTMPIFVCAPPTNLAAINITNNSADLSWTTGIGSTAWNLEYGNSGFTQGTGTYLHNPTNPITINGLLPAHQYQFYVRDSCSASDTSLWAGPFAFTTNQNTGIIENSIESFNIYPNPTNGKLYIDLSNINAEIEMSLLNLQGQIVLNKILTGNSIKQFDLTNYLKGIYFLKLETENSTFIKKIVIE